LELWRTELGNDTLGELEPYITFEAGGHFHNAQTFVRAKNAAEIWVNGRPERDNTQ
jgi:hypothetical protein